MEEQSLLLEKLLVAMHTTRDRACSAESEKQTSQNRSRKSSEDKRRRKILQEKATQINFLLDLSKPEKVKELLGHTQTEVEQKSEAKTQDKRSPVMAANKSVQNRNSYSPKQSSQTNKSFPRVSAMVNPLKTGVLMKRGDGIFNKGWKSRHFILHQGTLYWLKSLDDFYPAGSVNLLQDGVTFALSDPVTMQLMTPTKTYILSASSERDMDDWLNMFRISRKTKSESRNSQYSLSLVSPLPMTAEMESMYMEVLQNGAIFTKFRHGKMQKRLVWVSNEFNCICWGSSKQKVFGYIQIQDIQSIQDNCPSAQNHCPQQLSIVTAHRVLELQAPTLKQKQEWFFALTKLVENSATNPLKQEENSHPLNLTGSLTSSFVLTRTLKDQPRIGEFLVNLRKIEADINASIGSFEDQTPTLEDYANASVGTDNEQNSLHRNSDTSDSLDEKNSSHVQVTTPSADAVELWLAIEAFKDLVLNYKIDSVEESTGLSMQEGLDDMDEDEHLIHIGAIEAATDILNSFLSPQNRTKWLLSEAERNEIRARINGNNINETLFDTLQSRCLTQMAPEMIHALVSVLEAKNDLISDPSSLTEVVWENQRFKPRIGWGNAFPGHLLPSDPPPFLYLPPYLSVHDLRNRAALTNKLVARYRTFQIVTEVQNSRLESIATKDVKQVDSNPTSGTLPFSFSGDEEAEALYFAAACELFPEFEIQAGWEWKDLSWRIEFTGSDSEGWQYATNFRGNSESIGLDRVWSSERTCLHFVRRRKWIRRRYCLSQDNAPMPLLIIQQVNSDDSPNDCNARISRISSLSSSGNSSSLWSRRSSKENTTNGIQRSGSEYSRTLSSLTIPDIPSEESDIDLPPPPPPPIDTFMIATDSDDGEDHDDTVPSTAILDPISLPPVYPTNESQVLEEKDHTDDTQSLQSDEEVIIESSNQEWESEDPPKIGSLIKDQVKFMEQLKQARERKNTRTKSISLEPSESQTKPLVNTSTHVQDLIAKLSEKKTVENVVEAPPTKRSESFEKKMATIAVAFAGPKSLPIEPKQDEYEYEEEEESCSSCLLKDLTSPIKVGWMQKKQKSKFKGGWKRRFFVLHHKTLYWFKSDKPTERSAGSALLSDPSLNIERIDPRTANLNGKKTYVISSQTSEEMDSWIVQFRVARSQGSARKLIVPVLPEKSQGTSEISKSVDKPKSKPAFGVALPIPILPTKESFDDIEANDNDNETVCVQPQDTISEDTPLELQSESHTQSNSQSPLTSEMISSPNISEEESKTSTHVRSISIESQNLIKEGPSTDDLKNLLVRGAMFKKFRHGKSKTRLIWGTDMLDRICWGKDKKKSLGFIWINTITSVEQGCRGSKFSNMSFTVVSEERLLELEAFSEAQCEEWMLAILEIIRRKIENERNAHEVQVESPRKLSQRTALIANDALDTQFAEMLRKRLTST